MATARRQLGYVSSLTTQTVPVSPQTLDVEFLLVGGGGSGAGVVGGCACGGSGGSDGKVMTVSAPMLATPDLDD